MIFFSICTIFLNILGISAFNIDVNHAIIFTDESSDYYRSTYFGYTVILYSDAYNAKQTWVQIGSPRGNLSNYDIKEPGVVYRCNIFGPCMEMQMENSSDLLSYENSFGKELFGGAWLGGAMDINPQSGRVAVCGHRWRNNERNNMYLMEGVCYWSHVNDTIHNKLIPLKGSSHDFAGVGSRYQVFYYANGQAGICAHFSNSHEQQELLLGAPGVYNWAGTTIIYRDGVSDIPVASRLMQHNFNRRRRQLSTTFGAFLIPNIASAIQTHHTNAFELFGYSVTSGYFFKKDELVYASSAPRSSYKGQVLIFKFANVNDQALDIITSVKGQQLGEYFGASLTAGDINQDGLDDLIVGAPYYSGTTYNQGRIYIFLGTSKGKFESPQMNSIIMGENPGAQFGLSLMFLDNFNNDGDTSVAVGAPYENNNTGAVYIYRGSEAGLVTVPSQKIMGNNFSDSIKGFGISISKPTDVDKNFYNDLAIGAYISKHVVILRSKPVIQIQQSLQPLTPNLDHNSKEFQINSCFWYTGYKAPPTINITRKISVDELFLRAYIAENISIIENITLAHDNVSCHIVNFYIKPDINNRNDPITVIITPQLILHADTTNRIFATHRDDLTKRDTFCKECPISNPYLSTREKKIDFSFTLNCGEDEICMTNLNLRSKFINIQGENYVLGSTDDLSFEITIVNSGENAYQAQVIVELPNSIYFSEIPNFCSDQNFSSAIICNVGNPLAKFENKTINLVLDMRKVDTIQYGDTFQFNMTLDTSSTNVNKNKFFKSLKISREADITITGASSQQSYLLNNSTKTTFNFSQVFQIEKYGASPIEEVAVTIFVPTRVFSQVEWKRFAQLYQPVGMHGNQPIRCESKDEEYILEDMQENQEFGLDIMKDAENNMSSYENKDDFISRSKRSADNVVQNTEEVNVVQNNETMTEFGYAPNRIFAINCSDDNIICSKITCNIGPFTKKQNLAKIQLRVRLNVTILSEILGNKDIISLSTEGKVVIKIPENFKQTGLREDEVRISSMFIMEIPETTIESWIIIVAVIVGLLLLCLLILGLTKAGFFKRKIKQELKALKELDGVEQFQEESMNVGEDNSNEILDTEKENTKH